MKAVKVVLAFEAFEALLELKARGVEEVVQEARHWLKVAVQPRPKEQEPCVQQ